EHQSEQCGTALKDALREYGQQSLEGRTEKHEAQAHQGETASAAVRPDEFQSITNVVVDGSRAGARGGWGVRDGDEQSDQEWQEGAGVESERACDAEGADDPGSDHRTTEPRHIELNRIQREGGSQLAARHKAGDNGLEDGTVQRPDNSFEERE